jgi:hypothetical protein
MKRTLASAAALAIALIGGTGFAPAAHAEAAPGGVGLVDNNELSAYCQRLGDEGALEATGTTVGECRNFTRGPSNPNAESSLAAYCGAESSQVWVEAMTKGQCIQAFNALWEG